MNQESVYLEGLRDAYAMEKHAEIMLKWVMGRLADYPLFKACIAHYLVQTREQQQQVKAILKRYDSNWSALKDALGRMSASGQAASDRLQGESGIQIAVSAYIFCTYKLATYTTLLVAAEQAADRDSATLIQQILQCERQRSNELLQQLPATAQAALMQRIAAEPSTAI